MEEFPKHIILLGRFPPPPDGQSLATQRLANHLATFTSLHQVNTMIPADASALVKIRHYRSTGKQLSLVLEMYPNAPVVWTTISPEVMGHFRDLAWVYPYLKGRDIVAVVHWGKFAKVFKHPFTRWSSRRLIPSLERVIFTAPVLASACSNWIPESKTVVIPNTLDSSLIPSTAVVENRIAMGPGTPFRVLFLSNMLRQKGWEDVLDAAALLASSEQNYEWHFVGGWPDPDQMRRFSEKVSQLGLSDSVRHFGLIQDRSQIAKLHLESDLMVLPSWLREAQPLTILEAMAAGTPCVVARDGGMPDMIGSQSHSPAGVDVAAKQPAELARAIENLSNPRSWGATANHARSRFENLFAPPKINQMWNDVLRLSGGNGGLT